MIAFQANPIFCRKSIFYFNVIYMQCDQIGQNFATLENF